ncbi:unnamed protein product [Rotaria sp. Silwood2]|nr:unnamed protein product [Rotaria sp. Silwood2]CAF4575008.1 unnamed protein product [Rotaria sp. Silwood2]
MNFLPPSIPYECTNIGINYGEQVEEKLTKRTCQMCSLYLPSKTAKTSHNKIYRKHRITQSSLLQVKLHEELLTASQEFESHDEKKKQKMS